MTTPSSPRMAGIALLDRADYRPAVETAYRDEIYRLRYRAYLDAGLIDPSAEERVADKYEDAPNAWTFGIHVDGELCASVRIQVLASAWRMSFTTDIFGDVLHPRLDRGEVMIDSSRLTVDPEKKRRYPDISILALRLAYAAGDHFGADMGLAMVRSDHQAFYRRAFLHEPLCADSRPYPGWPTRRAVLTGADFPAVRDVVKARLPVLRSSAFERRMLFGTDGLPAEAVRPMAEAAE